MIPRGAAVALALVPGDGVEVAGIDRKVWPDARTGAKGQRPTHGRAGAGLASLAGTGAGAGARQVRRTGIFVALPFKNRQSSRRSDIMVAVRKGYAAPTGLEIISAWVSTAMPRLRRYGRAVSPLTAADCQRTRSGLPRRRAWSAAPYRGMVADRKVWPDARAGAKGQRPTHGRAGAGFIFPDTPAGSQRAHHPAASDRCRKSMAVFCRARNARV